MALYHLFAGLADASGKIDGLGMSRLVGKAFPIICRCHFLICRATLSEPNAELAGRERES